MSKSETATQTQTQAPTVETLADQLAHLQDRVETLEAEIERKDERIADLEDTVQDQQARLEAATRNRHHLAEEIERVETKAMAPADGETGPATSTSTDGDTAAPQSQAPTTPLERVVGLPESLACKELTANQERARFIAQDVRDYAERVPAGFAIPSTDLRKVLKAKDGSTPHTQTVARVMEFLDELGGEDVMLVKRRGTKRIAFSSEAVERLTEYASRATADETMAGADESITGVVMDGG